MTYIQSDKARSSISAFYDSELRIADVLKGRGGGETIFFFKVKPKIKTALLRESSPVVLCHIPPVSMRLMSVNHPGWRCLCPLAVNHAEAAFPQEQF